MKEGENTLPEQCCVSERSGINEDNCADSSSRFGDMPEDKEGDTAAQW